MALNDDEIWNLLDDGYNSDINISVEDDYIDDELQLLLEHFENDDQLAYVEILRKK